MSSSHRSRRLSKWIVLLTGIGLVAVVAHAGCGSDAGGSSGGTSGTSGTSGGFGASEGGVAEKFAKIVISPQDPVITVDLNAKNVGIDFTAKGIRADGSEVPLTGAWNFTRIDAAAFDGTRLVATGFVGGKGDVVFTVGAQSASTTATFKLRITTGIAPDPTIIAAFAGATENDGAMSVIYPYDKTVFPRGLPTPVVQWNGGANADIYRFEAKSDTFEFLGWTTAPPPSRYPFPTVPADVWAKLTDSTVGNVNVAIQRWDGTKAYKAKTQTWGIAGGNLKGSIYYTRLVGNEVGGARSSGGSSRVRSRSPSSSRSPERTASRATASQGTEAGSWPP